MASVGAGVILFAVLLWAGGYFSKGGEQIADLIRASLINAGLKVERVTLQGRNRAPAEDIYRAVNTEQGASLGHLDLEAIRERVEALGWVEHAAIARHWPDTLHVSIVERSPYAIWQINGELNLIDASGAVIKPVALNSYPGALLVVGPGAETQAADLLPRLEARPEVRARVVAAQRVSERRWNLKLMNGGEARLPENGLEAALDKLERLQTERAMLDRPVEYIDIRNTDQIILKPSALYADPAAPRGKAKAA